MRPQSSLKALIEIDMDVEGNPWLISRKLCIQNIHADFWCAYLGRGFDSPPPAALYLRFTQLQSEAYDPTVKSSPIASNLLPTCIHLIHNSPTSAAFSLLIMYSIRYRTLTDHPKAFHPLFWALDDSQRRSHEIGEFTLPSPSPL